MASAVYLLGVIAVTAQPCSDPPAEDALRLQIEPGAGGVVVSWQHRPFVRLEAAPTLTGPWRPVGDLVQAAGLVRSVPLAPAVARRFFRLKHAPTAAPALLEEHFPQGSLHAHATRGVTFGPDGAELAGEDSGMDFAPGWFAAEGTIESELRTSPGSGFLLDTRGTGARVRGDAVLFVVGSGQLRFAIDPTGRQNPGLLTGVTSTTPVADGRWHRVSLSYGAEGLKIYVDGQLEDSDPGNTTRLVRSGVSLGDFPDGVAFGRPAVWRRLRCSPRQRDVTGPLPAASLLEETLTGGSRHATRVREVVFGRDGATFDAPGFAYATAGLDYAGKWFPHEGTIEMELRSTWGGGGFLLDTRGTGFRQRGDAVCYLSGQAIFAIDPFGGMNPGLLTGVRSTTVVGDGRFHRLGLSYGSKGLRLYVDGRLEDTLPNETTALVTTGVTIGDYFDGNPFGPHFTLRRLRSSPWQEDIRAEPPAESLLNEILVADAPHADDVRAVSFGPDGATLGSPVARIGYAPDWFPREGTIELELRGTVPGEATILATERSGAPQPGDLRLSLTPSGRMHLRLEPARGTLPLAPGGLTSATAVTDGEFHRVGISLGSDGLRLSVDGREEAADPRNGVGLARVAIRVGAKLSGPGDAFLGAVRRLRTSGQQGAVPPAADAPGTRRYWLLGGAAGAAEIRTVSFLGEGALLFADDSALTYAPGVLPAEGTFELEIQASSPGWIADLPGDGFGPGARLELLATGRVRCVIDPVPGDDQVPTLDITGHHGLLDGCTHRIAIGYGAGRVTLYVDGQLEGRAEGVGLALDASPLRVGHPMDGSGAALRGAVRSFRISPLPDDVP